VVARENPSAPLPEQSAADRGETALWRLQQQQWAAEEAQDTATAERLRQQVRAQRQSYLKDLQAEVIHREGELKQQWQQLQTSTMNPEEFVRKLTAELATLSEADRAALAQLKKPGELERDGLGDRVSGAMSLLQENDARHRQFQDAYDGFNFRKLDYLLE